MRLYHYNAVLIMVANDGTLDFATAPYEDGEFYWCIDDTEFWRVLPFQDNDHGLINKRHAIVQKTADLKLKAEWVEA